MQAVVSINQTGTVPSSALSLLFKAEPGLGGFTVSLNGQSVPFIPLSNGTHYTLYGAAVSAFAGQAVNLQFSALGNFPGDNNWLLDSIMFSTVPLQLTVTNTHDDGSPGSLRQAIAAASFGGMIQFAVTGTIVLTNGELVITNALQINGTGATNLTISGNNASRIFNVSTGATLNVQNLTIAYGANSNGSPSYSSLPIAGGGGIVNHGNLLLSGCVVASNTCSGLNYSFPPGYYFPPSIWGGGGLFNSGMAWISNCWFTGNAVSGASYDSGGGSGIGEGSPGGGADGGAFCNSTYGYLTAVQSTFSGNSAAGGNGEFTWYQGTGNIYGGPGSPAEGGAECNYGILLMVNCTVAGNTARGGSGGAAEYPQSPYTLYGGGGGYGSGGGICNHGLLAITNCTLANNLTLAGSGGVTYGAGPNGAPGVAGGSSVYAAGGTNLLVNTILAYGEASTNIVVAISVVVSNVFGAVTSQVAVLTLLPAKPGVWVNPFGGTVYGGGSVNLSVTTTGAIPQTCQWFFGNLPLTNFSLVQTNVASQQMTFTLTLTNLTPGQSGNYTAQITNVYGAVTSAPAQVVVIPMQITSQPSSLLASLGTSNALTVGVQGISPLACQWYFNNTPLPGATNFTLALTRLLQSESGSYFDQWQFDGTNLSGATNRVLAFASVQGINGGNYDVVVSDNYGSVTSSVAMLVVPVTIAQQPTNQMALAGNAVFSVAASGAGPFTYQWYQIISGATNLLAGQTNATLALSGVPLALNGSAFFVVASDAFGDSATSALATLTVSPAIYYFGTVTDSAGKPVDGAYPYGGLLPASDGNLYGLTSAGGGNALADGGDGTVFRITTNGTFASLYSFGALSNATKVLDGTTPEAGLVLGSDGNSYGTTVYGGTNGYANGGLGCGTLFRITPTGGFPSGYSFGALTNALGLFLDGANPYGGLVQGTDGSFFGTTVNGGSYEVGTVFKIPVAGAGVPALQAFKLSGSTFAARWVGLMNRGYQVQYKTNLNQSAWLNLGSPISNVVGTVTVADAITNAQRFYRVVLLP